MRTDLLLLCGLALLAAACGGRTGAPQPVPPSPFAATTPLAIQRVAPVASPPAISSTHPPLPASGTTTAAAVGSNAGFELLLITRGDALILRDVQSGRERTLFSAPLGSFVAYPAWAPDRSRFAFTILTPFAGRVNDVVADWGSDLFVADAGGNGRRLLLKHDAPGGQFQAPSWTPDGAALVFTYLSFTYDAKGQFTGQIEQARRLNLATGAVTPLLDNATDTDLCRDGSKLAYLRFDPTTNSTSGIAVADGDGKNPRTVIATSLRIQGFLYPRFSPDCTRLVFSANAGSAGSLLSTGRRYVAGLAGALAAAHGLPYEVWTINIDGSELTRLTHFGEDEPYPAWSPDGDAICVLGVTALYRLQPDGSGLTRIAGGATIGQLSWR